MPLQKRPKLLFRVRSSVWEIVKGGEGETRIISDLKYDIRQGTWSNLVKEESGTHDLGWLGEYRLAPLKLSEDIRGCQEPRDFCERIFRGMNGRVCAS